MTNSHSNSDRVQAEEAYSDLLDRLADNARDRNGSAALRVNRAMDELLPTAPHPRLDALIIKYGHSEPDPGEAHQHYIDSDDPSDDEMRYGFARTVIWSDVRNRL